MLAGFFASSHVYGLIVALGIAIGIAVSYQEAKKRKLPPDIFFDLAFGVLIGGIIGARLYHVIHLWDYYRQYPAQIIAIWQGGLGIWGAIGGGVAAAAIYCRLKKQTFWQWMDIAAIGMPLGQAIGRWGNFFNQELYGYPTNLPWGIFVPFERRLPGWENYSRFHPLFLYECIWDIIIFSILLFLYSKQAKKLFKGELFGIYLVLYSFGRFWIEFLKPDAWRIGGLGTAQWIGLAITIACCIYAIKRKN